jgi:NADPH:quinone reductase-like Zn-dependent oxidoreductase
MTTAMQQWEIAAPGDANLRMVTVSKPWPKPGEILIEVDAVSLNYRERWIIDGGMGGSWDTPLTLGSDVAGRVVAVGEQVTRFSVGDRVTIMTSWGGWTATLRRRTPIAFSWAGWRTMWPPPRNGSSRRLDRSTTRRRARCPWRD